LNTRESIIIAISNLGGGGQDGLIRWIEATVAADRSAGIKLLTAIVPRQADIHVTRTAPEIRTVQELDAELQRQGLPRTAEIFPLSFASNADDEPTEAEIVAERVAKKQ
jgi:hypothetical protein